MWNGSSAYHDTERQFRLSKELGETEVTSVTANEAGPVQGPEGRAEVGASAPSDALTVVTEPGDGAEVPRRQRADARRNVGRILKAAEELFTTEGLHVPVDLIASRAGVGVGTLYRHFPTKEALFQAVVMEHKDALVRRARELEALDPADAFFGFLGELADSASRKKDLADMMSMVGLLSGTSCNLKEELDAVLARLLERAQQAGAVRADVTSGDVTSLLLGACFGAGCLPGGRPIRPLVDIICDGLRAGGPQGVCSAPS
jgi:AcrR family transcriptional regulator